MEVFPPEYRELMAEMLHEPTTERDKEFVEAIVDELLRRGRVLHLIHVTGRLVRNLAIYELIIGGDCWDRGPRGDRVVDYLRQQPNVSFIWGNHDVAWLGASLGHEALICQVLRVSLRYRRLGQLDEGYSIPLDAAGAPGPDGLRRRPGRPSCPKSEGLRRNLLVARMQKAIADHAVQARRADDRPQSALGAWITAGCCTASTTPRGHDRRGRRALSAARHAFADDRSGRSLHALRRRSRSAWPRLRHSFLASQKLGEHMSYLVGHGSMYLVRDGHLIFHGCVPCDERASSCR